MENSKIFTNSKLIENIECGGWIESNSDKDKKYFVSFKNGEWNCNCQAGLMKQSCDHITKFKNKFKIKNESKTIQ